MSKVDVTQLAIDRPSGAPIRAPRHVMTRYVLPAAVVLGFAAVALWGARDWFYPPHPVTVVPVFAVESDVQREGTPLFKAAGWIEPRPTAVRVAALAAGVVEQLLVVEDQAVRAGEAIAELVKDDARFAHRRAESELDLREAELALARVALSAAETRLAQPVHLDALLGDAEASLARTRTLLDNLPFELRRAEAAQLAAKNVLDAKLAASNVVAGVQVDVARSDYESATALAEELRHRHTSLASEHAALAARRDALRTQRELLVDETSARDQAAALVGAAVARVEQARIAVAEAELAMDRMTVRSPIDGRVFQLIAEPGARIGDGSASIAGRDSSTVVTLYRPEHLQVRVDVRFEDLARVHLRQPVEIANPALKQPIAGRVLFTSSRADIQKNTLEVKVELLAAPAVMRPDMLVDVTFLAPAATEALAPVPATLRLYLPAHVVGSGESGPFVWVADQTAGVARKTAVTTGAPGPDGLVEILSGVTASTRVIAGGAERLDSGDTIRITGEEPARPGPRFPKGADLPGGTPE